MQKIRHFIKSIKELCYDMNRSLPRKLSLCIAFPLFLLYSLELISGYYHQFTVFSIVFICIELCSIVLFIQFPYTGSIIIIILWITAISIKPALPYSFVSLQRSASSCPSQASYFSNPIQTKAHSSCSAQHSWP